VKRGKFRETYLAEGYRPWLEPWFEFQRSRGCAPLFVRWDHGAGPTTQSTRTGYPTGPGGFPGDKRNAFTKEGRSREQREAFDSVRNMAHLHTELSPLQRGELVNLHVSAQQYAYARKTKAGVVVVAINNDAKPATIEFDVTLTGLATGASLIDRIGALTGVRVNDGKVKVSLPARSAAVLMPR